MHSYHEIDFHRFSSAVILNKLLVFQLTSKNHFWHTVFLNETPHLSELRELSSSFKGAREKKMNHVNRLVAPTYQTSAHHLSKFSKFLGKAFWFLGAISSCFPQFNESTDVKEYYHFLRQTAKIGNLFRQSKNEENRCYRATTNTKPTCNKTSH